jgi:hypothetical protein
MEWRALDMSCNTPAMTELVGTGTVADFSRGAFLRGAASAFDLRGDTTRFYRLAQTPREADLRALINDIQTVIDDSGVVAESTR